MYDLIGDIHGHADELVELLDRLGYVRADGCYRHRERKAIFLGDFIDRGPKIRDVLNVVRPMIDSGSALAVMGNHEFNAIAYHTPDPAKPGDYLRPHKPKNVHQHAQTIEQLSPDELHDAVHWFRTLPLWLELPGLRVVHACWDAADIEFLRNADREFGGVSTPFMQAATERGTKLYQAVENVLKGKEAALPDGVTYRDPDGHQRRSMRIKWYESPANHTYRSYALPTDEKFPDVPVSLSPDANALGYPPDDKPVFFGHYC